MTVAILFGNDEMHLRRHSEMVPNIQIMNQTNDIISENGNMSQIAALSWDAVIHKINTNTTAHSNRFA
jgi:hypothetical protein